MESGQNGSHPKSLSPNFLPVSIPAKLPAPITASASTISTELKVVEASNNSVRKCGERKTKPRRGSLPGTHRHKHFEPFACAAKSAKSLCNFPVAIFLHECVYTSAKLTIFVSPRIECQKTVLYSDIPMQIMHLTSYHYIPSRQNNPTWSNVQSSNLKVWRTGGHKR